MCKLNTLAGLIRGAYFAAGEGVREVKHDGRPCHRTDALPHRRAASARAHRAVPPTPGRGCSRPGPGLAWRSGAAQPRRTCGGGQGLYAAAGGGRPRVPPPPPARPRALPRRAQVTPAPAAPRAAAELPGSQKVPERLQQELRDGGEEAVPPLRCSRGPSRGSGAAMGRRPPPR